MVVRSIVSALCGAVLFAAQAVAAPYYVITDLGFLYGGTESVANSRSHGNPCASRIGSSGWI